MRFSCVGAENVVETRCSRTSRIHADASNFRSTTMGQPRVWLSSANASGPEWYSGPVVRWTSSPRRIRNATSMAPTMAASPPVRIAPLGLPVVPDV